VSRRAEIQVGATVLVALAILIWGLAWLKEWSFHQSKQTWHVVFPESGGLSPSDEVQVNGMRMGEVRTMKLAGDRVLIDLSLDKGIVLTTDSRVMIRNLGLMGEKAIAVELRTTGRPYRTDEIIPGVYEKGMTEVMGDLSGTMDTFERLAARYDSIGAVLIKDGRLANTVANFDRTSEELRLAIAENRVLLRSTFQNLAAVSSTTRRLTTDREEELRRTLDNFAEAAENMNHLSVRLDSLRASLQSVTTKVDQGEGTLGKLVRDEQLYADLNGSVQSLKTLIEDIKAHPKRYFKFSVF
jgi:phospholipid/cholesterol/gamma-HCH transport system substrate-binding protein